MKGGEAAEGTPRRFAGAPNWTEFTALAVLAPRAGLIKKIANTGHIGGPGGGMVRPAVRRMTIAWRPWRLASDVAAAPLHGRRQVSECQRVAFRVDRHASGLVPTGTTRGARRKMCRSFGVFCAGV
jgi:hypothetical protein